MVVNQRNGKSNEFDQVIEFDKLPERIKKYFKENLKERDFYLQIINDNLGYIPREILIEYHNHKNKLSEICGWNSDHCDQVEFDKALKYLIDYMNV